jgi:proteasome lid subunit RPN8/RPN11
MKQNEGMPYPGINMFMSGMPARDQSPVQLPEDLRQLLDENLEDEQGCSDCYMQIPEEQKQSLAQVQELIQNARKQQVASMNFNQYANEKYPSTEMEVEEFCPESQENQKPRKSEQFENSNMNNNGFWKYNEDKTLKAAQDYISSTYHQHYTSEESKVQVLDIIEAIGDGVPFCRDNLIKYSARFGKKNGFSKLDALKIIHYGILLYNFAGFHNNTTDRYETF